MKLLFKSDPQEAEGKARGTEVPMAGTSPAGSGQRLGEGGRLLTRAKEMGLPSGFSWPAGLPGSDHWR